MDVTFVEAIKSSQWVKRKKWTGYMLVSRRGEVLRASSVRWQSLTHADLIADDWSAYVMCETDDVDDATQRFKLLELE